MALRPWTEEDVREIVAAHELGHAHVWTALGFTPTAIVVRREGRQAHGWVSLQKFILRDPDHLVDYLAGLVAGTIAGKDWCERRRIRYPGLGDWGDEERYREWVSHEFAEKITRAQVINRARAVLRAQWRLLERDTPKLHRRGSITL